MIVQARTAMRVGVGVSAAVGLLIALAVARADQTAPAPHSDPCGPTPPPGSSKDDGLFDDIAPSRPNWYDSLPACSRATRAAAKRSVAKRANGKLAFDRVVTVQGHLGVGAAPANPILFEDPDGQPSQCQPSRWRWELVLCGGERMEVLFRDKYSPSNFVGSSCGKPLLMGPPRDVVVSGKLKKRGGDAADRAIIIDDAKICRP